MIEFTAHVTDMYESDTCLWLLTVLAVTDCSQKFVDTPECHVTGPSRMVQLS